MSKTPVSTLNEYCMKHGTCMPLYREECCTIIGDQTNFVISIIWNEHTAKGSGLSKKQAKQNAATAMLTLLTSLNVPNTSMLTHPTEILEYNLQNSKDLSDSTSSSKCSDYEFVNHVGILAEYCVKNKIKDPCYHFVGVSGLKHSPIYTIRCTIDSLYKEGSGNTKKVAKHNAAKEIMDYLKDCQITDDVNKSIKLHYESYDEESEDIKKKYNQLKVTMEPLEIVQNDQNYCNVLTGDYHIMLTNTYKNSLKMDCHDLLRMYEMREYSEEDIMKIIKDSLNVSVEMISIKSKIVDNFIIAIKVKTYPRLVQIGISNTIEQAMRTAFHKLLEYIILFTK